MLLKVLGSITIEAKVKRIAAYIDGSIVGAAIKISLITAKFVDQTRQMPRTTPLQARGVILRSLSTGFTSILVEDSVDLIPVINELCDSPRKG